MLANLRLGRRLLSHTPKAGFANVEEWYKGSRYTEEGAPFYETPTRPGNFTDRMDFKLKLDNWFDEARLHNEGEEDVKRAQLYICNTMCNVVWLTLMKWAVTSVASITAGWIRYFPDKYMEFDIGELPPGEVMQISWYGNPLFVRRLTDEEFAEEEAVPTSQLMDSGSD